MTTPNAVTIGDTITLDDGDYRIVGFAGGVFKLSHDLTNEYRLIDHLDLARHMPVAPLPVEEENLEQSIYPRLEGLDDEARALIPHLQELLDGTPADGGEPRPRYALSVSKKSRLESKLLELDQLGIDMSMTTLKRRLKRFETLGPAGLADGRGIRVNAPLSRANDGIMKCLAEVLASYQDKSTPSATRIRADLRLRLFECFPNASDRPAMPALSTVQRYIAHLDGDRRTTGSARQRQTRSKASGAGFRARLAAAPGDECQVDTTRFDAFVRMPDGAVKRPFLSILVDKRTRSIMSFNFTEKAPTAHDHVVLVARALVPRQVLPWSRMYDELDIPEMPWAAHLTSEERSTYDTRRPYIYPQRIITDNGRDYTSEALRSVCARHGISLTESPYVSPTSKAHVERTFGTITTKFAQYLPGFSGSRTEFRGVKPQEEDVLDIGTVADLFDRWVAVVYQNRVHAGLVDPFRPAVRHTPNSMYTASLDYTGHFMVPLVADDFVAMMPKVERTVQTDGIEFRGRQYDSPHLEALRGSRRPDGKKAKFDVHYEPGDIHQVWVRSPLDKQWITCSWTHIDGLSRPFERALLSTVAKVSSSSVNLTDDHADELTLTMRHGVVEEAREAKASRHATHVAAKAKRAGSKTAALGKHESAGGEGPADTFTPLGAR